MLTKLITLAITVCLLNACSVGPGWQPSTIAEQVHHAGAVIYGIVDSVTQDPSTFSHYVHLRNARFYKGCGPPYVRINGFTSSAACGIDPPAVGDRIIVFVCRDGYHWKLNSINVFTGAIEGSSDNLNEVRRLTRYYRRCKGCRVRYYRCTKPIQWPNFDITALPDLDIRPGQSRDLPLLGSETSGSE